MKKLKVALFGFLLVIAFGACNTSKETTEISMTVQPTEKPIILPASDVTVIPTTVSVTPVVFTSTPEAHEFLTYEDCSSNWISITNGNWTLCNGLENPITIMNVSGKTWQFSYNSFYGKDVKNPCTRLHHLTRDETYLYFSLDTECELIEPGFVVSIGMFRMNLLNGEVVEVLKSFYDFETHDGDYYSVSISPTGRRMAYIRHPGSPLTLTVLDLQTGEERSFPLDEKYGSGGMFTWSEDGTKLVFMLENEKDYEHFISMVFLDLLKDDSMVTFIKDKEFAWISSRIEMTDNGVKIAPYFDIPLFYDVETGILSQITD
jgi:hypothetical protein